MMIYNNLQRKQLTSGHHDSEHTYSTNASRIKLPNQGDVELDLVSARNDSFQNVIDLQDINLSTYAPFLL